MGKWDTFAETNYQLVRLAQDAREYDQKNGDGKDVVLTFCDSSRIDGTIDMWVDARVVRYQSKLAVYYRKGDMVCVRGKVRYKLQDDGSVRAKIYDAVVVSAINLREREAEALGTTAKLEEFIEGAPKFE